MQVSGHDILFEDGEDAVDFGTLRIKTQGKTFPSRS
jgi:hypothetical protein